VKADASQPNQASVVVGSNPFQAKNYIELMAENKWQLMNEGVKLVNKTLSSLLFMKSHFAGPIIMVLSVIFAPGPVLS